ncbi:GNAT family N-acetyltransferase [Amycolatopsis sp. NPDC059021]|uniref:GNAT family N-acetyltransferase n=1 Tax=Amycolatopsis sp. NPDC059021 TaxID=3346704 RepID=UPI003671F594
MSFLSFVQSYIRTMAARGRETERIGPFLATYSTHTEHPMLNYAVPDDGAVPTTADVDALTEAYRRRDLTPRLEFLTEVIPAAEAVLRERGYALERRVPLMICAPEDAVAWPCPEDITLLTPETDVEFLAMVNAQREAYDEPDPASDDDVASMRDLLGRGGLAVLAVHTATGDPVGGGVGTALVDATTEIAGIGVRERYRRRGIAAALTSQLTLEAHQRGGKTVFLTPAGEPEERLYARIGYRRAAECVHLSLA